MPLTVPCGREAQAQPAGPVGHGARSVGAAPAGRSRRLGHIHGQVGARGRGDPHLRRPRQQGGSLVDFGLEGRVGYQPLKDLGMFVGDHQDAGAAGEDRAQLGRVQKALHGAVGHELGRSQGRDHRLESADGVRRAGGAHRHRRPLGRRGHAHMEHPRPEALQGQAGEFHVHRAALGLRQNRGGLAPAHPAEPERLREGLDPLPLNPFDQHCAPSPNLAVSCGTALRAGRRASRRRGRRRCGRSCPRCRRWVPPPRGRSRPGRARGSRG